jgi:hypothetical protein
LRTRSKLTTHRERQRVRARRRPNGSFIAHLRAGYLPNFNADIVDAPARCPPRAACSQIL